MWLQPSSLAGVDARLVDTGRGGWALVAAIMSAATLTSEAGLVGWYRYDSTARIHVHHDIVEPVLGSRSGPLWVEIPPHSGGYRRPHLSFESSCLTDRPAAEMLDATFAA